MSPREGRGEEEKEAVEENKDEEEEEEKGLQSAPAAEPR